MRLSSSLIAVCKLAFYMQSYSVICSTPWASALAANPPRKGPGELRIQGLCLVPSPLAASLFFSWLQTALLVFSPQFTCLLYAASEFLGRSFPLLRVGEAAPVPPRSTRTDESLRVVTDGNRQYSPPDSPGHRLTSRLLTSSTDRNPRRKDKQNKAKQNV